MANDNDNGQEMPLYLPEDSPRIEPIKRRRGRPSTRHLNETAAEIPGIVPVPPAPEASTPRAEVPAPESREMPQPAAGQETAGDTESWQHRRRFRYNNGRMNRPYDNYGAPRQAGEGAVSAEAQESNGETQPQQYQGFRSQGYQKTPYQNYRNQNYRNQGYGTQGYRPQRLYRNQEAAQTQAQDNQPQEVRQEQTPAVNQTGFQQNDFQNRRQQKVLNNVNNKKRRRENGGEGSLENIAKNTRRNPLVSSFDRREIDRITDIDRMQLEAAAAGNVKYINLDELLELSLTAVNKMAEDFQIPGLDVRSRFEVVLDIVRTLAAQPGNIVKTTGVLQVMPEGYGFLRNVRNSYTPCIEDVYVSQHNIRRIGLRTGDTVTGHIRQLRPGEQFFTLIKVDSVNGDAPEIKKTLTSFENLVPYFPTKRFILERENGEVATRVIDLVTPVGRGQRGLIVAGPRTGKTVVLQKIANSIIANNPDVQVIILLIDERPEEVTDMKREVKAEVVSSTFDEHPDRHAQVAEMVIEKAKRQVEHGHHVVILLDSITRLARAYNTVQPHSGRVLTGGVDANALHKPKNFFGAARNIEGGGSLTILATALVDTGSRMDEVIFEEFKGTGNMELHLDRKLVDRRLYPAVNVEASGTRREELLVHKDELDRIWALRRAFCALTPTDAMEELLKRMKKYKTNIEFLLSLKMPREEE